MSWFKRSPRAKDPAKSSPKKFSPATERSLQEAKLTGQVKIKEKKSKS